MEVWNTLCYCVRDHVVFLPDRSEILRPDQVQALLSSLDTRTTPT